MSWRVVVISSRSKLELKMNYLVVRGEDVIKVHLSEISVLIIETTGASITASLLCELIHRKIKVIFCDEKRNPSSELVPYYGSHDTSVKYKQQLHWSSSIKAQVWEEIVKEKINKQLEALPKSNETAIKLLKEYKASIQHRDKTNREAHAAKIYFSNLFGDSFTRANDDATNAALNYGYSILLSAVNREIVSNGYLTQLGIFHDNMFNQFNLGSDLMEPFRPLVDKLVIEMNIKEFEHDEKMEIVNIMNKEVIINDRKQYLNNAIGIYCKSIFDALNDEDISLIRFYKDEL